MIKKIHIQNFKSIYDLELEVGRVNLFIGENGSGKSNLLEALVFVSANQSNKLDDEFLFSRGLRVPSPELMRSAFHKEDSNRQIIIAIGDKLELDLYSFNHDNTEYGIWRYNSEIQFEKAIGLEYPDVNIDKISSVIKKSIKQNPELFLKLINHGLSSNLEITLSPEHRYEFKNFIIYSPENTALRVFQKEGQIQPLGINGEGLLKLLKVINNYEDKSYINTIIESLQLFDWFENITIPTDIHSLENIVTIKDKYLYREFTQRSANEGFLFILFYITLIVAKETPKALL